MERVCREPSLAQLLADPMTQALMASDGVAPGELDDVIAAARRRMRSLDRFGKKPDTR